MSADHLHIYNRRGYCWCGAHRDDWLRNEDMLDKIGKAFTKLADDAQADNLGERGDKAK
jgi:hypothetical protein